MQPHGGGKFQSSPVPLVSRATSFPSWLCPTGVVSQACAWIIYDLISLDLARAHVSLPPLVHWLHLSSVGTKDSPRSNCIPQCWGSTHSLLSCLWWPAVENSSEDPELLLSLTGTKGGQGKPNLQASFCPLVLWSALSCKAAFMTFLFNVIKCL